MAEQEEQQESEKEQSLMGHLIELRDRLLHMVLAILIMFVCLFAFSEDIFTVAAQPLLNLMPEGTSMIATGVTSPFLVPLNWYCYYRFYSQFRICYIRFGHLSRRVCITMRNGWRRLSLFPA